MISKSTVEYIIDRMKEASTYGGTALVVLGMMHIKASPDQVNAALGVLVAIGGFLAVIIPEGPKTPPAA